MERPTTRPNLGVMAVLTSHIGQRHDLLAVMRTCKTVHSVGIPALLKENIAFPTQSKLASFCDFILADAPVRAKHIRDLTFCDSLGEVPKGSVLVNKFAQVLHHATRLEKLTFHSCDEFVASDPKILHAFAGLTSVKDLTVREAETALTDMVKQMQSPVEKAKISPNYIVESDYNPLPVLSPFQATLRELSACQWFGEGDKANLRELYPNTSRLDFTFWTYLNLVPMIRAFPNVRHLSLHRLDYDGLNNETELREENEGHKDIQWKHLDHIEAEDLSLYVSALKAEVKVLDLLADWASSADKQRAILSDIRPERFNFHFKVGYWVDLKRGDGRSEVLEAVSNDLTHLYIHVEDLPDDQKPETVLGAICYSLSSANKLVQLSLKMVIKAEDAEKFDCKRWAQRFANSASSLENIVFNVNDNLSFWGVGRADDETSITLTLKKLTEGEALERNLVAKSKPDPHWLVHYYESMAGED